jgi:Putative transposase/Transposase zinc-binding domain
MLMANLITQCTSAFHAKFGAGLQPLHRRALDAMLACRRHCGECFMRCDHCQDGRWVPLSCGHRACPQCQVNLGEHWFARQQQKLLPVAYFMVTFTLPAQLRGLMWRHQSFLYDLFFQAAATTLKTIGKNNHQINIGMTGILHTHTRALDYHPHIHFIVPGGGLVKDKQQTHWKAIKSDYLINEMALAQVFRGIFLKSLAENGLTIPAHLPKEWVVNIKAVGRGEKALRYLSRYLYRGVIAQNAIQPLPDHQVRYRYQHSKTKKICFKTLSDVDFLGKLIQHILPKGFRRVRDYGFLHANAKKQLQRVQLLLRVKIPPTQPKKKPPRCANCLQPTKVIVVIPKRIPFLFRSDVNSATNLHFTTMTKSVPS